MIFNLEPLNTQQKSFYGKAVVHQDDSKLTLVSYSTPVAEYDTKTGELEVHGEYSLTTMRHLKAFINIHTNITVNTNDDIRALIS